MSTNEAMIADAWLTDLDGPVERNVPLGPRTWYGVGGTAAALARPRDVGELAHLVYRCREAAEPVRVVGRGANLLVADGVVDGVVVLLDAPAFRRVEIDPAGSGRVTIGGGANLEKAITTTVREGLAGLEVLAGIPATLGGALRMNAGGAFGEIAGVVSSVTAFEPNGEIATLKRDDLHFAYRRSNLGERIVVEASVQLRPVDDQPALRDRLKEVMRYKKLSQPMADKSAGCAFKNPRNQSEKGAGQLIDEAGLKGLRIGGAEVSQRHANFIVVHPGATATDILTLMDRIQNTVAQRTGVALEREVVVWGEQKDSTTRD